MSRERRVTWKWPGGEGSTRQRGLRGGRRPREWPWVSGGSSSQTSPALGAQALSLSTRPPSIASPAGKGSRLSPSALASLERGRQHARHGILLFFPFHPQPLTNGETAVSQLAAMGKRATGRLWHQVQSLRMLIQWDPESWPLKKPDVEPRNFGWQLIPGKRPH